MSGEAETLEQAFDRLVAASDRRPEYLPACYADCVYWTPFESVKELEEWFARCYN